MIFSKFPDISLSFSFNNKPSCQSLSKALDMQRKTPLTFQPSGNDLKISQVIDNSWMIQEPTGRKPDGFLRY